MTCLSHLSILILVLISTSIKSEILFEDDFNEFNDTKWEIISSETQCMSEFTTLKFLNFNNYLVQLRADRLNTELYNK